VSSFTKSCLVFALVWGALTAHAESPAGYPLAISHRACMLECPENTVSAIAWAAKTGADFIEIDLRASRDGELVVIHDKTVKRTTNGLGRVKNLDLKELVSLDAGKGERIPTMDEAFAATRKTQLGLLLDLKDVKGIDPEVVYAALVRHNLQQRVVIGARSVDQLIAFKALDPDLTTMAFTKRLGLIPRYIDNGVDIVRLWARWVKAEPKLISQIRGAGRQVWVTTGMLRGPELASLIKSDVQGLITDYPGDVLKHRQQAVRAASAAIGGYSQQAVSNEVTTR